MKILLTAFALMLTAIACTKSNTPKELPERLQTIVSGNRDCTCGPYINAYKWRGQIVFLLGYRGPACNWTPTFYDEDGNTITMANNYPVTYFFEEAEFLKRIWEC